MNLDHIVNDQTYIPVSVTKNKIADNEQLEWKNGLTSKPKLRTYVKFKLLYITEFYVTALLPKNKRSLLSRFRCGVLPLATETGRYKQVPRHERYCSMCKTNSVEDEIHFLCHCNFYKVLRDDFFQNVYLIDPSVVTILNMSGEDQLILLLNDKFIKCTASFISNAWYKRQHALFN